ncbi:MAG TPA: D-aminoacylase [Verrucomicrobiota bacterium]|nr:D-aminoacylase [Verrucomicrobiota bacterium]HNU52983.1 D-aminoacylase [Verrucomicrobiota bacterium]
MHATQFDVLIRNGTVYDGSGQPPVAGDVAVRGDTLAVVGQAGPDAQAKIEIDARGLAVAPGFINILSWACESLIADGRAQSDVRQGVTLEVMGEGESFGPLNPRMRQDLQERQGDITYEVTWTTLGQFLEHLARRGVSVNVASFVGASTARIHELGYVNRPPTPTELDRMKAVVRQAMEEGALGLASALIYTPGAYASTDELIALAKVAADHDGLYISHLRSEGNGLLEALDEFLAIARQAGIRAEVYHLKAMGQANWPKIDDAIARIEAARASGLSITADMYTYTAAGTGLNATMPPWVQEGGVAAWIERLQNPACRARLRREMTTPSDQWENFLLGAGAPDKILLTGFRNERLKPLTGKSLAEVAAARGQSPEETILDLVVEDRSRVESIFFLMSEENVRRQLRLPWVSLGSDEGALMPDGVFLKNNPHPRAYGNFARFLGHYVREQQLLSLAEAIRRLTTLPAANLQLDRRGALKVGHYADVVVFDPAAIRDRATYEQPHQYAVGVRHVLVNGVPVIRDGEHTGARPGRVVRGPGYRGREPR